MPLSDDPAKRERQLANLKPGAGQWRAGATPQNLRHGLRSRRPDRVLLGTAFREIVQALEDQVPLRDADGEMLPHFVTAIEVAALKLVRVQRAQFFLLNNGETDERGNWRPENDALVKALDSLERSLEKLGATPTSYARLASDTAHAANAAARANDHALQWAREHEAEQAQTIEGEEAEPRG